jgi:hypothetical protein
MTGFARVFSQFLAAALLVGLTAGLAAAAPEYSVNRPGGDYTSFNQRSNDPRECEAACSNDPSRCRAWTYVRPGVQGPTARCWLKNVVPGPRSDACCTSGVTNPQPAQSAAIDFCFSAYGNPERPFPGYVGPFQLGPVRISGSGTIRVADGALLSGGQISHTDSLRDPRYPFHATTWQVVRGYGLQRTASGLILRLQVRVAASNHPDICPVGTYGVVTLVDDKSRLPNGQTNDGVGMVAPNPPAMAVGGPACRTHVHGMNNSTVTWTDPPYGGAGGGMWASVTIGSCRGSQTQQPAPPPPTHHEGGVFHDQPQ